MANTEKKAKTTAKAAEAKTEAKAEVKKAEALPLHELNRQAKEAYEAQKKAAEGK